MTKLGLAPGHKQRVMSRLDLKGQKENEMLFKVSTDRGSDRVGVCLNESHEPTGCGQPNQRQKNNLTWLGIESDRP
ncbi:hypothetical protein EUGRSUZ_B03321 [Eucalyptus grandis]|uniref:Uncharacterized protein n=2 Tax=Eucalyptus grandis TaxID=71139 RepID=A0ACC3LWW6_EUCGR|nr:hypothetical protein EUGRSUZ_B03321 [Eucalyptus grandis]